MSSQPSIPQSLSVTNVSLNSNRNEENRRSCWVCFATDEDDNTDPCWVQPCNCRGTTKWVHQSCLQRWVDEKQRGNSLTKVSCPQCNTEYIIVFPDMGQVVMFLDTVDTVILKVCPFLAAGVLAGAVYWTAITYGAITIMQVVGHEEGLAVMGQAHALVLIVGLPAIPVMLIFGKMVRWEETALIVLRKYTPKIPILKYILPSFVYNEEPEQSNSYTGAPSLVDTICATRVFCSALLLPTIATFFGKLFYESVPSKVQRTLLGGITFILVKGLLRIYHKQQKYVQKCHRKILDYTPDNIKRHQNPTANAFSSTNASSSSSSQASTYSCYSLSPPSSRSSSSLSLESPSSSQSPSSASL
ncbi:E3 ubiquitin-protein ligase MARCHF5-like [Planococcus citri]|uniref:E3 ubiquitin-protein ligase MARCHF5-like n=1 Tax=Planococcus citri TaxID=170843 RepID=UPI0031F86457